MVTATIPEGLQNSIDHILRGAEGYRVGVALSPVAGGDTRTYGDESAFVAASTAKLITAAAYYHLVEVGEATLEQQVGDYSAAFQLEAMINTSNNDSWLLLMAAVGYPDLIQYAASIGITYDPQQNLLTPKEMALFLRQLCLGDLLNPEDTGQLLSYMQNTNVEGLIPAASGPNTTVHHKYGQIDGSLHDVALLSVRETAYVLVIYTEGADSTDLDARIEMIHELTETIVDAVFPFPEARG
ncbi:serine hydrolase [Arthrobacter sp. ISL-48]|nr:serine hydrolase [Arthrobacter sp. ISL-48]